DDDTARVYGEIKTALRRKGRPIPDNDIWIAAVAIQHSLSLVSRDEHFANIERLSLVRW
ncbi:MAG: type II toxin-antitoxin system VapC family toxin, partial [Planctomycetes bacterium]|nr:type II toxin-antitoxin system VapC family toxin [Planctomycetota bacterium]